MPMQANPSLPSSRDFRCLEGLRLAMLSLSRLISQLGSNLLQVFFYYYYVIYEK